MKKVLYFLIINLLFMLNTSCAQLPNEEEKVISMLETFYTAYNSVWSDTNIYKEDEFEEKVFSLQQKYCSKKLQSEIREYYKIHKFEHDLLTNDFGGTNEDVFKSTLKIEKDKTRENTYIVSYIIHIDYPSTPRDEKNIIKLEIIKESGNYKINKVL